MLTVAANTTKPVAVLAGLPAAIGQAAAAGLRTSGIPVLEGTRTGLLASGAVAVDALLIPRHAGGPQLPCI